MIAVVVVIRDLSFVMGVLPDGYTTGWPNVNAKNLHARTEKLDLELVIGDGFRLSDQRYRRCSAAAALLVGINSVSRVWRLSNDQHPKFHRRSRRCRPMTRMRIAGVKTVRDNST